jgi:hypothetical protein
MGNGYMTAVLTYFFFILTANGFSPDGSGTTIRHNTQSGHNTHKERHNSAYISVWSFIVFMVIGNAVSEV